MRRRGATVTLACLLAALAAGPAGAQPTSPELIPFVPYFKVAWGSPGTPPPIEVCALEAGLLLASCIEYGETYYPPEAIVAGLEGAVVLEIATDAVTGLQEIEVIESVPGLDRAALAVGLEWYRGRAGMAGPAAPPPSIVQVRFNAPRGAAAFSVDPCRGALDRRGDPARARRLARALLQSAEFVAAEGTGPDEPPEDLVELVASVLARRLDEQDLAQATSFLDSAEGRRYLGAIDRVESAAPPAARSTARALPPVDEDKAREPDAPPPWRRTAGTDYDVALSPAGAGDGGPPPPPPPPANVERDPRRWLDRATCRELRVFDGTPAGVRWRMALPCIRADVRAVIEQWRGRQMVY